MIQNIYPGSRFRIRILIFYPSRILDPGVKKTPDPGSGFATLPAIRVTSLGVSTVKGFLKKHLGKVFIYRTKLCKIVRMRSRIRTYKERIRMLIQVAPKHTDPDAEQCLHCW
jgi:hypothetical protein